MLEEIKSFINRYLKKNKFSDSYTDERPVLDDQEQFSRESEYAHSQMHHGSGDNVGRDKIIYQQTDLVDKLNDDWFKTHITTSIENLGKRYTPELNFDLEIGQSFNAISRNEQFYETLKSQLHTFLVGARSAHTAVNEILGNQEEASFLSALGLIKETLPTAYDQDLKVITTDRLYEAISIVRKILNNALHEVFNADEKTRSKLGYSYTKITQALSATYDFSAHIERKSYLELANKPCLMISGRAGVGKSHLLADVANKLISRGVPCLLLLGQNMTSDSPPWTQILRDQLRLDVDEKQVLERLNSHAQSLGERCLIMIDAVNEGRGRYFWPQHLSGFISEVSKYPWIGLVFSIRESYEKLFLSEIDIDKLKLKIIKHVGFEGQESEATSMFFRYYGIEEPAFPIFNPEFSNPLFLKIFCEGLSNSGLTKIPKGFTGISKVIQFFLESINQRLSRPSHFDYPSQIPLINNVLDKLIHSKLDIGNQAISYEKAYEISNQEIQKYSNQPRFLDALIAEGVLSRNIIYQADGKNVEVVYFAYERFEDHLTAKYLLDRHLNIKQPENSIRSVPLSNYIQDRFLNQGIIEALSIQIPELCDMELYELVDEEKKDDDFIIDAFLDSLLWRQPKNINEKILPYLNDNVLCYADGYEKFIDIIYQVCADTEHFFNADRLHKHLNKFSLAERDEFWTIYIHDKGEHPSPIGVVLDWAMNISTDSPVSDESRLLAGTAISWLFTTSNVFLRDQATRALAVLLVNRFHVSLSLLKKFDQVSDPYVYERLSAGIYGATLNSSNFNGLEELCDFIVSNIFEQEEVYPNVLVRDYLRNIVEFAIAINVYVMADKELITPPYKSKFPDSFPTNKDIDNYTFDYNSPNFKQKYFSQNAILHSMVTEYGRGVGGYGDFGRYVFQSAVRQWDTFDPNDLSNLACKLIFDKYGYSVEAFGEFDRAQQSVDRSAVKKERIGKKYQWLALYEILARLADNHKVIDESTKWGESKDYIYFQGPWEPFVRNIDPTLPNMNHDSLEAIPSVTLVDYADWDMPIEEWVSKQENLPDPRDLIETVSEDGTQWITLDGHFEWEEESPLGYDRFDGERKHLWCQVRSYLVSEDEELGLVKHLKGGFLLGRHLPRARDLYQIFSREYYWSPAYDYFEPTYYGGGYESLYEEGPEGNFVAKVLSTAEHYMWESGSGYQDVPTYLCPVKQLFDQLELKFSSEWGIWKDSSGEIVCFDTKKKYNQPSKLLIKKSYIEKFVRDSNLRLVWTCIGEKQILGGFGTQYHHLEWVELSGVYQLKEMHFEGEFSVRLR